MAVVNQLDLAAIFSAAAQTKLQRAQLQRQKLALEDEKRQSQLARHLPRARELAFQGNFEELWRIDPQEAIAIQESQAGQQQARQEQALAQQQAQQQAIIRQQKLQADTQKQQVAGGEQLANITAQSARQVGQLLGQARQNPAALQNIRADVDLGLEQGLIAPDVANIVYDLPDDATPRQLAQAQAKAFGLATSQEKPTGQVAQAQAELYHPDPRVRENLRKRRIAAGKRGQINLTVGGKQGVEKAFRTKLQEAEFRGEKTLGELKAVQTNLNYELFTRQGAARVFAAVQKDKLGLASIADKKLIGESRRAQEGIGKMFDAYRVEVTGAGAAMAELEKLQKSALNNELSPEQLRISMQLVIEATERASELRRKYLREGVGVLSPEQVRKLSKEELGKYLNKDMAGFLSGKKRKPAGGGRRGGVTGRIIPKAQIDKRLAGLPPEQQAAMRKKLGL